MIKYADQRIAETAENQEQRKLELEKKLTTAIFNDFFDRLEKQSVEEYADKEKCISLEDEFKEIQVLFPSLVIEMMGIFSSTNPLPDLSHYGNNEKFFRNKEELLRAVRKRLIHVFVEEAIGFQLPKHLDAHATIRCKLPFYVYTKRGSSIKFSQEIEVSKERDGLWLHTVNPSDLKFNYKGSYDNFKRVLDICESFADGQKLFSDINVFGQDAYTVFDRVESIYLRLVGNYTEILREEINLTESCESMKKLLDVFVDYGDSALLKECAQPMDMELRKQAYQHKDETVKELKDHLKSERQSANEMDTKRDRFHKMLERFAYLFLYGKSKQEVRFDLEQQFRWEQEETEKELPLSHVSIDFTNVGYRIRIGELRTGASEHGDYSHARVKYLTQIESKSLSDDLKFIIGLMESLQQNFPFLQIFFGDKGGIVYHEGGTEYAAFLIDLSSVRKYAEESHISFEACEQRVLDFIDKKLYEQIQKNQFAKK